MFFVEKKTISTIESCFKTVKVVKITHKFKGRYFIRDKKRVIPCASLCEGEFDINGYFIGVPTVIGSNGVEKILTFELNEEEKNALENTLSEVKKTVEETGL